MARSETLFIGTATVLVILAAALQPGSAQFQSCHDATGCGGNEVTGVSNANDCCLGSGLSFRDGGTCRQCIVHGFNQTTDLVINEGATQEVIGVVLDVKGNTLTEPSSARVLNFGFSFTCIDSSNGGGPRAVDQSDYTNTGCGSNIQLRMFPSAQRRSEVGITAIADDKIEGTEVLIMRLMLTSPTQTAINNAGNIFFQDTLNMRVRDETALVIGFSEDDYTGDEGETGDVSRPNTPCTVTVEIIERSLEIPLQIRLTPGEGNATRRDFNDTIIVTEVPAGQTQLMQAIQIFDDEINEGREVFNVSLDVSNISSPVQYRIQTTLCRIRQSDSIEIGFTQRRIFHNEVFRQFDAIINKSRTSEQTFFAQVEISTLSSPFGQSATRGEDFQTGLPGMSTVLLRLLPFEPNIAFSYQIIGDNIPENQEVFQLSVTPAIGSPTFTCTQANGCFQQLEIVIVNDDVVVVGFVDTLVEVNETDGQATLNVSITQPLPMSGLQIMFALRVDSMDDSAASYSAIDTLRNPIAGVEDFPRIVDGTYYTFQEMPFNILEFGVLNQMFNGTQRSQTFTFPIFVDNVPEGVEELNLTLSLRPDNQLPEGSVNVTPAVATVRIHDSSSVTTPPPTTPPPTTPPPTTQLPTTSPLTTSPPTTPPLTTPPPTTPPPTTPPPTTPPPTTPPPTTPPPTTPPPTTPPPTTPPPTTPPPTTPPPTTPPPTTPPPTTPPPTSPPPTTPTPTPSSGQFQSCHDATGCGENEVTGVSNANDCCLGSGLSFRDGGTCRQCIVHGFVQTTDLLLNEGATQEVIRMKLDIKGNTLTEPASTRVRNFGFSFTCIDSTNGGGPQAVNRSDYTDTGCGNNIQLRLFPSSQRRSEVGINAVADAKIEGTEVLILRLILTSATQTAVNNAGNIFFQDTLNIRVIDVTVTTPPPTTSSPTTQPPTTSLPTTSPPTTSPPTTSPPTTSPPTTSPPTTSPPTTSPPTTSPPTTSLPTTSPPTTPPPTPTPLVLSFINDSPRVQGNNISVDVQTSRPVSTLVCSLTDLPYQDCSSGSTTFTNVPPRANGSPYILRVVGKTTDGVRTVLRKVVRIEEPGICAVHLIGDGVTVNGDTATVQFAGVGSSNSFLCSLDRQNFIQCSSGQEFSSLSSGQHRLKIVPNNCGRNRRPLVVRFVVE